MTIEKIQENIQTVYELRNGVKGLINETLQEFRGEKTSLQGNRLFTSEGKREQENKLREKSEKNFLGRVLKVDDMVNLLLDESKDDAEKILTAAVPPVNEQQQKLFDMTLKSVEGKVTFALGMNQAMGAIEELVQAANEPLLAQQALGKFMTLSQTVLGLAANSEKLAVKQQLGAIYKQLNEKAQVEGANQVRAALKTISAMKGAGYVTGYVQNALNEISPNAAEYVNNPRAYFEQK
jgi:hypothetical protein